MDGTIEAMHQVPEVFGVNHQVSLDPVPQARHRSHGRRTFDPHSVLKAALRARIEWNLLNQYGITNDMQPLTTSYVSIDLTFLIRRPASHFINGDRGRLRDNFQNLIPTTTGDIDNYVKFFLDAIDGLFFRNDRDVVSIKATKLYCNSSHGRIVYNVRPYIVNTITIDSESDNDSE